MMVTSMDWVQVREWSRMVKLVVGMAAQMVNSIHYGLAVVNTKTAMVA